MIFPTCVNLMRLMHRPRLFTRLLLMLWFGLSAGTHAAAADESVLTPVPERPLAPDFSLPGPDGRIYRLADDRGRPVILNFWATWCPPCRAEMPSMQRAHDILAGEVAVIAINVGDDAASIADFLVETPVNFPLPMDLETQIAPRYPMFGLPTTFIIDPEGRLVYSVIGEQEWDDPVLLDQVRALRSPSAVRSAAGD
ncbi:TlpA family protein disulfide reductase [Thiobaca trueperi]|uniref:Thiol-disulfide isomerase/thioredoxin n=1 Tax=Thiobaca trueperi TaxID=127458 RepID=A0A4R3N1Z2_9GAMM|nr:TlpA disulfide reductase family protein [Thiobaca trueperi]TCT20669.1 thiol-disulfide isomerase/thioredoxin [Thiobaca trueperi]